MSKTYCKIAPDKGASQFNRLKQQLGYKQATELWNSTITHQDFLEDYKSTLVLDEDGIPTFESIMSNPYIQQKIGKEEIRKGLESQFQTRENTRKNFQIAIGEVLQFNQSNPNNDRFVAVVDESEDSLKIKLLDKTESNQKQFSEQYGIYTLNNSIHQILQPLGITEGTLKEAGVYGITDFSKAKSFVQDLISVADSSFGERALSEEFAHLCIEVFKDNPLISRIESILTPEEVEQILGDTYDLYFQRYQGDTQKLREEALGKMLQQSFFRVNEAPKKAQTLFQRLVSLIKNLFSKIKSDDLHNSLVNASTAMDSVAKSILSGDMRLTKEAIKSIQRIDNLYDLQSQNNKVLAILNEAIDREAKLAKIQKNDDFTLIDTLIFQRDQNQTALGIATYLNSAITELERLKQSAQSITATDPKVKFGYFRMLHNYINMYSPILNSLNTLLVESLSDDEMKLLTTDFNVNGIDTQTIKQMVDRVTSDINTLQGIYQSQASQEFAKFLKPFLGENLVNPFINGEKVMSVEELIRTAPSDISFMDKWFAAMSESSDVLLQLFDQVVKKAKDKARLDTVEMSKQIQRAYNKARNAGVTDFTFMYRYRNGQRTKLYIGDQNELNALTDAQREFYNTFMEIKRKLDYKLDSRSVNPQHVIQIKKDHTYGALGLIAQGKFDQAGEYFRNLVFESGYDDQQGFGVRRTLKGFDNTEYMLVPKYYLRDLEDQSEVSDDPVSSLIAYAYMANNYKELDDIVDALETGKSILKERKVSETRGAKKVKEVFSWGNLNVSFDVQLEWDKTNIAQKLDRFFNSQIYGRYLEDQGVWHIMGKDVNIQKLTNVLLGASSHIQLGFNWLANTANVANGIAMTNIEAAAGRYFKPSQLLQADKIYTSLLKDYVLELSNPVKTNKLALISEYFDVKQDAHEKFKVRYDKAMLTKIFGPNVAFIGQEAGDHWLYNRIAIAYLLNTKVKDAEGNDSNLYEALEVVIEDGVGKLRIKDGWDVSESLGNHPNIYSYIGRQIANINQKLFGIYNKDDQVAASQVAQGRLVLQYRKWIMPAINKRFEKAQYNVSLDEWNEGYYRTAGRFLWDCLKELKRGEFQLRANWDNLSPEAQENIIRALTEVVQYWAVLGSIFMIGLMWPDKKERPWLVKFLDYQAKRQKTELGALLPGTPMLHEGLKIINSPAAGISALENAVSLLDALVDPLGWFEERESGPYKGMNNLEKAIYINTPYIKSIRKATRDIDTATQYFNK